MSKVDLFLQYAIDQGLIKELPAPPRPGLVFNRASHRWERENLGAPKPIKPKGSIAIDDDEMRYLVEKIVHGDIGDKAWESSDYDDYKRGLHAAISGDKKALMRAAEGLLSEAWSPDDEDYEKAVKGTMQELQEVAHKYMNKKPMLPK